MPLAVLPDNQKNEQQKQICQLSKKLPAKKSRQKP